MVCYICGSSKLYKFLSLGHQPPSDNFLTEKELNLPEVYYPLDLYFCPMCTLVQLGYAVDPEKIFRDYLYTTGENAELRKNFEELTELIAKRFSLKPGNLAIDIGSNDGTLLKGFERFNVKVLGVEPSSISKIAIENNIPTLNRFFNEDTADLILKKYGKATSITATNVFAHVHGLESFMKGIQVVLEERGVFVTESHYLLSMLSEMQYDSIYHEHLRYYSLKSLVALFEKYGMDVFDAQIIPSHGGSIRAFACKKGAFKLSQNVSDILKTEKQAGLFEIDAYDKFAKQVSEIKFNLQNLLREIQKQGARIYGIGAPAKGSTLINYCGITPDIMQCTVETSKLKIGKYTPGNHIPIFNEARLFIDKPEYALILSWNIKSILIPKLKQLGYNGKYIIPNPAPEIM